MSLTKNVNYLFHIFSLSLQCMIEPVKVELVDTILLFRFTHQYIRLTTRRSLPE